MRSIFIPESEPGAQIFAPQVGSRLCARPSLTLPRLTGPASSVVVFEQNGVAWRGTARSRCDSGSINFHFPLQWNCTGRVSASSPPLRDSFPLTAHSSVRSRVGRLMYSPPIECDTRKAHCEERPATQPCLRKKNKYAKKAASATPRIYNSEERARGALTPLGSENL